MYSDEIEAARLVYDSLKEGLTPHKIAQRLNQRFSPEMPYTSHSPREIVGKAMERGWLKFLAPGDNELAQVIHAFHPSVRVAVVSTASTDDLAHSAAASLLGEMRKVKKDQVHIGFSGGHTMRRVAQALAQILQDPPAGFRKRLVFHSLVGGFEVDQVGTEPNAFFLYLSDPKIQVDVGYRLLHAPPLVTREGFDRFLNLPWIRAARDEALHKLDIVVSSAAAWGDKHSQLPKFMGQFQKEAMAKLGGEIVGDMLWTPIGRKGPMDVSFMPYQTLSLLNVKEIQDFAKSGKTVFLVVGACGFGPDCPSKEGVLRGILTGKMVSHIVIDRRTAQAYVDGHARSMAMAGPS